MNREVCAIVVTFNRKELLRECLRALMTQTNRVGNILVLDNASTDGTDALFSAEYSDEPRIRHVRLPQNIGGAGGFRRGLQLAHELGFGWFWLMDDDTIPAVDSLEALLRAYQRFPETAKPVMLSSKVEWTDGTIHGMNLPTIKRATMDPERTLLAAEQATISVRWASFVSLLIQRSAIDLYGLPCADYFIWNDDTEYTARVLRSEFGVLVPQSVVTHKTARKHSPIEAAPDRAYYQARNVLWMILKSSAWELDEKWKIGFVHMRWIVAYLQRAGFQWAALRAICRGVLHGVFNAPSV